MASKKWINKIFLNLKTHSYKTNTTPKLVPTISFLSKINIYDTIYSFGIVQNLLDYKLCKSN